MSMYYKNKPGRIFTKHEDIMKKDFPFVSRTELAPFEQADYPKNTVDRLNNHNHHSPNTHLIISGSLTIGKTEFGGNYRFRQTTYYPGQYVNMPANVFYRGTAGPKGCVFVEGHQKLSPASAQRFLLREHMVTNTADDRDAIRVEDQ